MTMIVSPEDLQRSLTDNLTFDLGLAEWALETVSAAARDIARRPEWTAENTPPGVIAVVGLAARRLYTNPDRMTRENDGDYGYALDSSVTNAAIFTPSEIGTLRRYAPGQRTGGLRTLATTRDESPGAPHGYVPDGTAHGFPWYGDSSGGVWL